MIEPIEKSKIDLLDSEYKKQFSRVSNSSSSKHVSKYEKHHLNEVLTSLPITKAKTPDSISSTTSDATTLVPNNAPQIKLNQSSTITTITTKLNDSKERGEEKMDVEETTTGELKGGDTEIPIVKSSSTTNLNEPIHYIGKLAPVVLASFIIV